MKVLVTGAGGFIGSHLVEDQLRRGREVTAVDLHVDSLQPLSSNPRLKILKGDFADRALLDAALPGNAICFHLASAHLETGVDESYFFQVNVQNTSEFIERCQTAGIRRFVHCSSVGVYGNIQNPPADEGSECHPDIPYEKSKLAGEKALMEYARECEYPLVIVRPAWVYGPRCPRTLKLFKQIQDDRFFYIGDGGTLRHPIYIDDMVEGFEQAGMQDQAVGEVFIMAGPKAVTIRELVEEIARTIGKPAPRLRLPKALVLPGVLALEAVGKITKKDMPFTRRSLKFFEGNTAFSIEKARQSIGFNPRVELSDGLQRTYAWFKEAGKL